MQFLMRQRRWAALLLIWFIILAGVHLGYAKGQAVRPSLHTEGGRQTSENAVAQTALCPLACGKQETPSWKRLPSSYAVRYAGSGSGRRFSHDFYAVRLYSGMYTRILLPSRRAENVCSRSHALIMNYIHCQDGAKPDSLFSIIS